MGRATHRVGFRHFTFGEWREPGTLVDASTWPNRGVLEESGYLHPLPEEDQVELEAGPGKGGKGGSRKPRAKNTAKPKSRERKPRTRKAS